jgi:hypothetical protein
MSQARAKMCRTNDSILQSCHGKLMNSSHLFNSHLPSGKHKSFFDSLQKIAEQSKPRSSHPRDTPNSLITSGTTSFAGERWTLTKSSRTWLCSEPIPSASSTLLDSGSKWSPAFQSARYSPSEIGPSHGGEPQQQLPLCSPTDAMNCEPTQTTLLNCSERLTPFITAESSSTTSLSVQGHRVDKTCFSQTLAASRTCAPCTSPPLEMASPLLTSSQTHLVRTKAEDSQLKSSNHADGSTSGSALTQPATADINMFAPLVPRTDMSRPSARKWQAPTELVHILKWPRFARDFLWENHEIGESPSAQASETAPPVPCIPEYELNNTAAATTIHEHPELFQIVTPINVDRIQHLLRSHPNQALVLSVCKGFREGFWPWADTSKPNYPITWDNAHRPISDPIHRQFLRDQRDEEIRLRQYSASFGTALLPRMYRMPLSIIPKPHSDKLRLINHHRAGQFSCNSMIPNHEGTVKLDGMRSLGKALRHARKCFGHLPLILWKADVSRAYRLLPMHVH